MRWQAVVPLIVPTLALSLTAGGTPAQTFDGTCTRRASGQELAERASPPDSALATLDGETVKVCYSSPRMRDREIFGGLVPFEELWRLGADEATRLWLPFDARLGGLSLDAGGYALYVIPDQESWEFFVTTSTDHWGRMISDEVRSREVGSFTAPTGETGEPVENFTIRFEENGGTTARMVVEWERTRVRVPLEKSGG